MSPEFMSKKINLNIHDLYHLFARWFRSKRMRRFAVAFHPDRAEMILDVGGTEFNWALIDHSKNVVLLNLGIPPIKDLSFKYLVADGRALPFPDQSVTIVYSNSVIEHLSNWENQQRFAAEVRRVGKRYYIQTPNRRFWIEPHLLTPFIHFLPQNWQKKLLRHFTLWGWLTHPSKQQVERFLEEIRLLSRDELTTLFPDGVLWEERFFVWIKSFIVCKL